MHVSRWLWCTAALLAVASARDFYMGMFKKQDRLVALDRLYKERVPFGVATAQYGRKFDCLITYVKVTDRLGVGAGPNTQVVRGGLHNKLLVLRIRSPYNTPISVNVYVGCVKPRPLTITVPRSTPNTTTKAVTSSDKSSEHPVTATDSTGATV